MKIKIIVTRPDPSQEYGYKAAMEGRPEKIAWGRSLAEAVGGLISKNFEMQVWLDLDIVSEDPAAKAS